MSFSHLYRQVMSCRIVLLWVCVPGCVCVRYIQMEIMMDGDRKGAVGGSWCNKLCVWALGWGCMVCGSPCCQQDITARKGLRHMVIQIQFRYSQHTRLQQKERRIGQVGQEGLWPRKSFILQNLLISPLSVVLPVDPVCLQKPQQRHPWVRHRMRLSFLPCLPWAG